MRRRQGEERWKKKHVLSQSRNGRHDRVRYHLWCRYGSSCKWFVMFVVSLFLAVDFFILLTHAFAPSLLPFFHPTLSVDLMHENNRAFEGALHCKVTRLPWIQASHRRLLAICGYRRLPLQVVHCPSSIWGLSRTNQRLFRRALSCWIRIYWMRHLHWQMKRPTCVIEEVMIKCP